MPADAMWVESIILLIAGLILAISFLLERLAFSFILEIRFPTGFPHCTVVTCVSGIILNIMLKQLVITYPERWSLNSHDPSCKLVPNDGYGLPRF